MTEQEWLAASDLSSMFVCLQKDYGYMRSRAGRRRLRLFLCGCCRQVWPLIEGYDVSRLRVEVAERYADDAATRMDLDAICYGMHRSATGDVPADSPEAYARIAAHIACSPSLQRIPLVCLNTAQASGEAAYPEWQINLLRCIVGSPFRPVACDPSWRTSAAVSLAQAIYAERAFDRLPILADALEEAGCTHPDVLTHCRGDGPHARGCWVVDLILGKV